MTDYANLVERLRKAYAFISTEQWLEDHAEAANAVEALTAERNKLLGLVAEREHARAELELQNEAIGNALVDAEADRDRLAAALGYYARFENEGDLARKILAVKR